MQYLLVRINSEKFFRQEIDPETFEAELKRTVGDSKLEQISLTVGGQEYHYLVTTEARALRPKLIAVRGVAEVLAFETKPMTD